MEQADKADAYSDNSDEARAIHVRKISSKLCFGM